ncbi:FAD-dependent oxidoreductase [Paraburkholderia sp. DGU8]|uniref:FAD-dependent oxidoreductase n=1 Tax=Paraburkholderia sp. DGU8 TaxID=3161997 RepID=UPI0034676B17
MPGARLRRHNPAAAQMLRCVETILCPPTDASPRGHLALQRAQEWNSAISTVAPLMLYGPLISGTTKRPYPWSERIPRVIGGHDAAPFEERSGLPRAPTYGTAGRTSLNPLRLANALLREGGLDRRPVTPDEIRALEPTLHGQFHGGFFTASDSTGDIHKFTRGLAEACVRLGVEFRYDTSVQSISEAADGELRIAFAHGGQTDTDNFDRVVICAGVGSRALAAYVGDHVNVYPVKGYSITVWLDDTESRQSAPWVSLLDDNAKIVTSRLGVDRFRVAGTAELNGMSRDIRSDRIKPLVKWTRTHFPDMSTARVVPWAGLRPMLPGMLPKVGAGRRRNIFYNTGHGHLGWTLSAATAEAVAELVAGSMPHSTSVKPTTIRKGLPVNA